MNARKMEKKIDLFFQRFYNFEKKSMVLSLFEFVEQFTMDTFC